MPRQWLSFWSEKTTGTDRTSPRDAEIYVPFGQGKLAKGDGVYRVAVVEGELWLFGRVIVGRIAEDPEHAESLDVWAEPGTETTWCEEDCVVDESVVDELSYLDADGTEHRMPRDESGRLDGTAFQGSSSILEVAGGSKALDQLAEA
jgi:YD repeat-containing protein